MTSFEKIYKGRPDQREVGSSGYSNMKNLYDICTRLKPNEVVESGTWKGNSSWLFHHFADVVCHDIQFEQLMWSHEDIVYWEFDIEADCEFEFYKKRCIEDDIILFFFDDHISHLQRLEWLIEIGARYAVFDDNQPHEIAKTLKNPPTPTLEELREQGHPIMNKVKHYEVMPFHGNRRGFDNRLTFITL